MVTVLLIRHGQNDWVNKKRLAGWTPGVHLNEEGQQQARDLAQRLAHLPIKAIYSSPLERCMETAAAVAGVQGLEVIPVESFGEVRYGKWEGKTLKKLAKKREWHAVQHYPSRFRFPEGEWLSEVQDRAVMALESACRNHDKELIAVVSHADVIKLVLAHYLGVHIDLFQRITVSPASVSVLALIPGGPVRVLRINDNGPLQPPAEPDKGKSEKGQDTRVKQGENGTTPQAAIESEAASSGPIAEKDES